MTIEEAKAIKSNVHATFDSAHGKETMKLLEKLCSWYPTINDSSDTNDIIARDANRKVLGTIKSILNLSAEQIVYLQTEG